MQNLFFMNRTKQRNQNQNVLQRPAPPKPQPQPQPQPPPKTKREQYTHDTLKNLTNVREHINHACNHVVTIVYERPEEKYNEIMAKNKKIENSENPEKYFWEYDSNDTPLLWVSMLIPSYNTKKEFLIECIDSIKEQVGHFGLELVWINDGSTPENTKILEDLLHEKFKNPLEDSDSGYINHFNLVYHNNIENKGIRYTLNKGVTMCTHELVFRFDSDDIMLKDRIVTQIVYMLQNPDCVLCGSDVYDLTTNSSNNNNEIIKLTNFSPVVTWEDFVKNGQIRYILSHPTYCFRKSKIVEVGNYNKDFEHNFEDLELVIRILKKYNKVHSIGKPLILYRDHEMQITKVGGGQLYSKVIEYVNKVLSNP
jgi:glycosyltransferase involved in cell wall biosynthesis